MPGWDREDGRDNGTPSSLRGGRSGENTFAALTRSARAGGQNTRLPLHLCPHDRLPCALPLLTPGDLAGWRTGMTPHLAEQETEARRPQSLRLRISVFVGGAASWRVGREGGDGSSGAPLWPSGRDSSCHLRRPRRAACCWEPAAQGWKLLPARLGQLRHRGAGRRAGRAAPGSQPRVSAGCWALSPAGPGDRAWGGGQPVTSSAAKERRTRTGEGGAPGPSRQAWPLLVPPCRAGGGPAAPPAIPRARSSPLGGC